MLEKKKDRITLSLSGIKHEIRESSNISLRTNCEKAQDLRIYGRKTWGPEKSSKFFSRRIYGLVIAP